MKLMTNKGFQAELDRRDYERHREFHTERRFDDLEKRLYLMEGKIAELEEELKGRSVPCVRADG